MRKTVVPYDQDQLVYKHVGFGHRFSGTGSSYFLGTSRSSRQRGNFVVYKFTGKSVSLISTKAKNRSKAKIFLDGRYMNLATPGRRRFDIDGLAVERPM